MKTNIARLSLLIIFGLIISLLLVLVFNKTQISKKIADKEVASGYTTSDNKFYKNGKEFNLHGVSWFGFEDKGFLAHGLWTRPASEIVSQIKDLGFNAVRLPFCPPILKNPPVDSVDYDKNPGLTGKSGLEIMDMVINELDKQGVYILLDLHNFDCTNNLHPLWYTDSYPESQWLSDWSYVVNRYKNIDRVVGVDLKNEPHDEKGVYAQWGTGDTKKDWKLAAEMAGSKLLAINPKLLIFVQGIGDLQTQCSDKYGHFWGGNFEPVNCFPIDNSKIPANKMVYTPHVYGPDVSSTMEYFASPSYPQNLPAIWDKQFGFLLNKGHTVVIGEFGGKYGHDDKYGSSDPRDKAWQNKIVDYMITKQICNYFYWSLNPDSGDTGGILQEDWLTPHQDKVDNLNLINDSCK